MISHSFELYSPYSCENNLNKLRSLYCVKELNIIFIIYAYVEKIVISEFILILLLFIQITMKIALKIVKKSI